MARRYNETLFEMGGTPRPRWAVRITMLALAVVALAAAFGLLPLGPSSLSSRQARKLLTDARKWEQESLYRNAAELYAKVADNAKAKPELRLEAAERLHLLYRDQLRDNAAAEAALEKVYHFTPAAKRDAVRQDLETLRGYPVATTGGRDGAGGVINARPADAAKGEVARIGNQTITIEDILFAWQRSNPGAPPTEAELEPFVRNYLDMALMASAAEERQLDKRGRAAHELRFTRLMTLNGAMMQLMIQNLPAPSEAELETFYREVAAPQLLGQQRVKLGHIVVSSQTQADRVARLLTPDADFGKLAEDFSKDADTLERGFEVGEIGPADAEIPRFGHQPGLAARLCAMDADATTGPLRSERGWHFFKVLGRAAGSAPPLAEIHDEVLMLYQRQALARERQRLLAELRQSHPMELQTPQLADAMRQAGGDSPPPQPAPAEATTDTTATAQATPTAEATARIDTAVIDGESTDTAAEPTPRGE